MTCSYCKTEAAPGSRFCPHCGAPLAGAPPRHEAGSTPYGGGGAAQAIAWTPWVDQTEGAFGVLVPKGWNAQGGVKRGAMYNLPECVFQVVDPAGRVGFVFKPDTMQFSEPMGSGMGMLGALFGMFGGGMPMMGMGPQAPTLPFQDAVSFARGFLLTQWRGRWPDIALVQAAFNPLAQARQLRDLQQSCQQRAGLEMMRPECSSADVTVDYTAGGQRVRQSAIVHVSRLINPMGPSMPWFAEVPGLWFAPVAEFGVWDPILRRILESVHINPQWQAAQVARDNNATLHDQMDRNRRLQQISQTLSQTSQIVSDGYWSRSEIHQAHAQGRAAAAAQQSDWQHEYSNAILGWEDRWDDNGNHHSISAGHERVWVDPGGGYHYGNQLSNPDPTWSELKLRGGR